jgi:hypothetical protein
MASLDESVDNINAILNDKKKPLSVILKDMKNTALKYSTYNIEDINIFAKARTKLYIIYFVKLITSKGIMYMCYIGNIHKDITLKNINLDKMPDSSQIKEEFEELINTGYETDIIDPQISSIDFMPLIMCSCPQEHNVQLIKTPYENLKFKTLSCDYIIKCHLYKISKKEFTDPDFYSIIGEIKLYD